MLCPHKEKALQQQGLERPKTVDRGDPVLQSKLARKEIESIVTNPARLAINIREAECESSQEVEEELEKVIRGETLEKDKKHIRAAYGGGRCGPDGSGSMEVRKGLNEV